jgi:hypothetical protein
MARLTYRAHLAAEQFPLISEFQGPQVITSRTDHHYSGSPFGQSAAIPDKGIPEAYYLQDVMPSKWGYKSVGYDQLIPALPPGNTAKQVYSAVAAGGFRALILVTNEGSTYILGGNASAWLDITPLGQPTDVNVSIANVTGTTFLCYSKFNIFVVDIENETLLPANIVWDPPLTNADMVGISASNNYLLAHDGTTLYWSSSLDVLDMQASQITGAGSGIPTAAIGSIIALAPVGIGFAVYCQGNTVVGVFSGNVQYPWTFKESPNSAGIDNPESVSPYGDDNNNYVWTSAGLLQVTLQSSTALFPEVSDFLGGLLFESFNLTTKELESNYLVGQFKVRLAYIDSRYLCISYGTGTVLTHVLVYDAALKRWGKLAINHAQIINLPFELIQDFSLTFNQLTGSFDSLDPATFDTLEEPVFNVVAAKRAIAAVGVDGSLSVINFDYGFFGANSVLMLGKYQLSRESNSVLTDISIEVIDADNNNFELIILSTLDGKTVINSVAPTAKVKSKLREYCPLVVGQNHALLIIGSFHLTSVVLTFASHGDT